MTPMTEQPETKSSPRIKKHRHFDQADKLKGVAYDPVSYTHLTLPTTF